jgi:hypothetical protein
VPFKGSGTALSKKGIIIFLIVSIEEISILNTSVPFLIVETDPVQK